MRVRLKRFINNSFNIKISKQKCKKKTFYNEEQLQGMTHRHKDKVPQSKIKQKAVTSSQRKQYYIQN